MFRTLRNVFPNEPNSCGIPLPLAAYNVFQIYLFPNEFPLRVHAVYGTVYRKCCARTGVGEVCRKYECMMFINFILNLYEFVKTEIFLFSDDEIKRSFAIGRSLPQS